MANRLLALDQASLTTGWSVFIDGELIKWGHFTAKGELGDRLLQIREFVIEKINEYDINQIAFEDIQFQEKVQNNVKTFKALAEVFGVIYELATELKIPNQAILAGTWKSSLGIKGKNRPEQKKNAQTWVVNTYNIKCTQDEADSICIGSHIVKKGLQSGEEDTESFDWD